MSWSIPIARVLGSTVRIHVTFFLLLLWIAMSAYSAGGWDAARESLIFVLAIFGCVLAHEYGHALAARRYGIRTPDITLLPIGGVARLERMPTKPGREIVVALAGPAVNVVIALVLILFMGARFDADALAALQEEGPGLLARIASINVFLAVFNLIPAFPMDGGRVLRALLSFRMPRRRATHWAARIGQGLAFVFGFVGLFGGNVLLVFIAVFIYLAATAESQSVGLEDVARRIPVTDAMITRFEALPPDATLRDAADALIRTTQHEFPVVDGGGRLRGVLTRTGMVKALNASGPAAPVLDAIHRDVPLVSDATPLDEAMRLMRSAGAPAIGVTDEDDRFIGYVTTENVGELMMIDSVRAARGRGAEPPSAVPRTRGR